MRKTNIKFKLAIEVTVAQFKGPGALCNPRIGKSTVNFHYLGGDSVSVVTKGIPQDSEIIIDVDGLKKVNDFLLSIHGMKDLHTGLIKFCEHRYSKAMNQEYPRKCIDCGEPEYDLSKEA
jgi:hypothetical protein